MSLHSYGVKSDCVVIDALLRDLRFVGNIFREIALEYAKCLSKTSALVIWMSLPSVRNKGKFM